MTDNVFEYNETYSAAARDSSPTLSPSGMTASLDDAKALSVLYVVPYLPFLLFAAGIIFAARIFRFYDAHCHKGRHSLNNNNERDNVDGDEFHQHADTFRTIQSNHFSAHHRDSFDFGESTVVALGLRDRIRLYRRTFDKSKNFHILSPNDFYRPDNNPNQNEDETINYSLDDGIDAKSSCAIHENDNDINSVEGVDDEDPSWLYLPLARLESNCDINDLSPSKKEGETIKREFDAIYSSHTCETIETTTTTSTTAPESIINPLTKVSGSCIICFEKFRVGETIVWSGDTTKCKHVFHEDCMIRFLANNSKRTKRPFSNGPNTSRHSSISYSYATNPCPICRQKFCTVRHDDLVMAVLLKSVAVALGEEDEDLPISSRGGGEGSPFTSSERSQRIVATSYALASATMGMDSSAALPNEDAFVEELEYGNMSRPDE